MSALLVFNVILSLLTLLILAGVIIVAYIEYNKYSDDIQKIRDVMATLQKVIDSTFVQNIINSSST